MRRHLPHILASDKDMYVALTVIVLKYSKHFLPKAQEKTLAAMQCTPNMTRSSKPMLTLPLEVVFDSTGQIQYQNKNAYYQPIILD
jgi:hypothetical protein